MQKLTVFYSWQSDLPSSQNRSFIERALEQAIQRLNAETSAIRLSVDQGTRNTAGAPNIAEVILGKIRKAAVFVADITPVTSTPRAIPNPNVTLETGYALGVLGESRLITVTNTAVGAIKDLPFDLGYRRTLPYRFDGSTARAPVLTDLPARLAEAIRASLPSTPQAALVAEAALPEPDELSSSGTSPEWRLPIISMSDPERFWLELMANEFESGRRRPAHVLKRLHHDRIPSDFNQASIDERLLSQGSDITLLGLWHVDPATPWLWRSQVLMAYIKKVIRDNPEVNELSVQSVAKKLNLTERQVSSVLQIAPGHPKFASAASNEVGDHYFRLYSTFSLGREDVFRFYESFHSIDSLMC